MRARRQGAIRSARKTLLPRGCPVRNSRRSSSAERTPRPIAPFLALSGACEAARSRENFVQHGLRELACEGVLLARVVGAEQPVGGHDRLCSVTETGLRTHSLPSRPDARAETGVPGKRPEGHDDY